MAKLTAASTSEVTPSRPKNEIIKEAQRIEESLTYSAKGHLNASESWSNRHFLIGIPSVALSALAGVSALGKFDPNHYVAAGCSVAVAVLTGMMTFLNPDSVRMLTSRLEMHRRHCEVSLGAFGASTAGKTARNWCLLSGLKLYVSSATN